LDKANILGSHNLLNTGSAEGSGMKSAGKCISPNPEDLVKLQKQESTPKVAESGFQSESGSRNRKVTMQSVSSLGLHKSFEADVQDESTGRNELSDSSSRLTSGTKAIKVTGTGG